MLVLNKYFFDGWWRRSCSEDEHLMLQGKEVFYFLLSRENVREVIRDMQETESSVNLSKIA